MRSARNINPLFVALDTPDLGQARALATAVKPHVGGLKVGLEFITALGPDGVRAIAELGLPVFADVKFHDIPNTVAGAARAIASLDIAMFNVHAAGGEAMMQAAIAAVADRSPRPRILGVTVLTSLGDEELATIGQLGPASEQVARLALLAKSSGLDGVVASAREIAAIRRLCGDDFLIVTPGIRPAGAELADQRRVVTPADAMRAGADILVVGRPITAARDPEAAARTIADQIRSCPEFAS